MYNGIVVTNDELNVRLSNSGWRLRTKASSNLGSDDH